LSQLAASPDDEEVPHGIAPFKEPSAEGAFRNPKALREGLGPETGQKAESFRICEKAANRR